MTTDPNKSPPQHTPLPWKTQPLKASSFHGNGDVGDERLIGFKIDNGSIEDIVTVDCRGKRDQAVAAANADFIVSACNSHYELIEALEACCERFRREIAADPLLPGFFGNDISPEDLLQPFLIPQHGCIPKFLQACAAIVKARGQR